MSNTKQPPDQRNRYHNLMFNTALFAIATFAPKLISFLINGIVTRFISTSGYGEYAQIYAFCNLVLPIVYITISEAVIRFGSDGETKKTDVYTTAILVLAVGYTAFIALYPMLKNLETMGKFAYLIYPYVLASALRTINGHFVRSLGNAKLFAVDGIITSLTTTILSLVFLIPLQMGPISLILATIVADALSTIFLFTMSKSWRYFKVKHLDFSVSKQMIIYSLLIMPTSVFWWIINASNRTFIRTYHGQSAAGLYENASHIPSLILMVSQVFMQAWQMSAFSETEGKERDHFFAGIFKSYYTFLFLAISGVVLIVRPFMKFYAAKEYYESWQYVPFLLLGIGVSCLVTFLGTIYNTHKKNFMITLTTAFGAGLSFSLNRLLIPSMGPQGAAISTLLAYLVVFLIRLFDTRRFIDLGVNKLQLLASFALLIGQILISLTQPPLGILWQILIFGAIVLLNIKHILFLVRQLLSVLQNRKQRKTEKSSGKW